MNNIAVYVLGGLLAAVALGALLFLWVWRSTQPEAELVEKWLALASSGQHREAAALLDPSLGINEVGMASLASSMSLGTDGRVTWQKRAISPGVVSLEGQYKASSQPSRALSATVTTGPDGRPVITHILIDTIGNSLGLPDATKMKMMVAQTLAQLMKGLSTGDIGHLTDFRDDDAGGYLSPVKALAAFDGFRPQAPALLGALTAGSLTVSDRGITRDGRIVTAVGSLALDGAWPWKVTYVRDGEAWIAVQVNLRGPGGAPYRVAE